MRVVGLRMPRPGVLPVNPDVSDWSVKGLVLPVLTALCEESCVSTYLGISEILNDRNQA